MSYYQQKQFIAIVDKNDRILGKMERWEAHKKSVLHRGFTAVLSYNDKLILQHRKHPAFDGYWDLTFSSHQIYKNHRLQTDLEAVYNSLGREWNIQKKDLIKPPELLGKIYYQAKDPKSIYTEHEIDYIFYVILKKLPRPNPDFAYGSSLITKKQILNNRYWKVRDYAPWVKKIIKSQLIRF